MIHKFDARNILKSYITLKGLPYLGRIRSADLAEGEDFEMQANSAPSEFSSITGARLRAKGTNGRWVFMPVSLGGIDLSCAVLSSVSCRKRIVSTPLIGHTGSVKELIACDDYKISVIAVLSDERGVYPEQMVQEVNELFKLEEPVELKSALTDLLFTANEQAVITSIEYPSMQGVEDAQVVHIECVSDKPFDLYV